MEGEETNTSPVQSVQSVFSVHLLTLVCHVYEPLQPQCVQGGDEVQGDPGGHEERQADPVDDVPGGGEALSVPLTAVEQRDIRVNQPEFILKLQSYTGREGGREGGTAHRADLV